MPIDTINVFVCMHSWEKFTFNHIPELLIFSLFFFSSLLLVWIREYVCSFFSFLLTAVYRAPPLELYGSNGYSLVLFFILLVISFASLRLFFFSCSYFFFYRLLLWIKEKRNAKKRKCTIVRWLAVNRISISNALSYIYMWGEGNQHTHTHARQ